MLTRRQLVRRSAAGAAVVLLPAAAPARAAALRGGRFRQGVLSGDPTPDGITLLTPLDDVDFVVCLGDYIYAESYHAKGKTGVRDDKNGKANSDNPGIVREAVTLKDYRGKYATYRSDAALRDVHARFPMISIWDDHE